MSLAAGQTRIGSRSVAAETLRDDRRSLSESDVSADPLIQLQTWLTEAIAARLPTANAMTLATASPEGRPSARIVLLKGIDRRGLTFFTNYRSRKGRELAANPYGAINIYWPELERQVRSEGAIELVSDVESDAYFRTRPFDSQLGAWVSDQSEIIQGGRTELDRRLAEMAARFAGQAVPRPPHWGGYRLIPDAMEFWQARPGRLHDRLHYTATTEGWSLVRLAP
jgi:pyridoxamine 5'-phosphate oxidase